MNYELRAKKIIIIGGASGIGFAAAKKLLDCGAAKIIIASRNKEKLASAKNKLDDERVSVMTFDISDCSSHEKFIRDVNEMIGDNADGLVISSGLNFDAKNWKGFNISISDWDRVMDTNLKGVFFLMRNFANYLHSFSIKGNICIVSSISAHRDLLSVYQISKNAISGICHAYGKYLCERKIVLNCVEPGTTAGGMLSGLDRYTDGIKEGLPWNDNSIRRVIRPEEIAEIICFLMSNLSEVMSGSCLLAGGGEQVYCEIMIFSMRSNTQDLWKNSERYHIFEHNEYLS